MLLQKGIHTLHKYTFTLHKYTFTWLKLGSVADEWGPSYRFDFGQTGHLPPPNKGRRGLRWLLTVIGGTTPKSESINMLGVPRQSQRCGIWSAESLGAPAASRRADGGAGPQGNFAHGSS
ncbi:hypothetical protein D1007_32006 [Hordeum vulgare]|nr:hypothetical protein D1007_32006 [Hordeum vulgare]